MRSTKVSAAIERLKKRSNEPYSMGMSGNGLFWLSLSGEMGASTKLCEPMGIDEFVAFVNAYGPQTPKRVSMLEVEFSKQLLRKVVD